MKELAISIVFYHTPQSELDDLLHSLANQDDASGFSLYCLDNSDSNYQSQIAMWLKPYENRFAAIHYFASNENLGFGRGHNANFKRITEHEYILILNQDIIVPTGALKTLCDFAEQDDEDVGVWEMRQIPYEHPKIYNPSTLETGWVAGAACLFRQSALTAVGGFDEDIFMYAEDVDISWRLQCNNYRCRYVPKAAVIHHTYSEPGEIKKTLIFEGTLTHLLLRARYGTIKQMLKAPLMLLFEIIIPEEFEGRRRGMLSLFPRYFKEVVKFRRSGSHYRKIFKPTFFRWDFSKRREGAFYEFDNVNEWTDKPKVSIIVRTCGRPKALDEALASIANQTYDNIEIVVVEDGPAASQKIIEKYRQALDIQYQALGENHGRSYAGNVGLSMTTGEWCNFLDDDDQLFADHVEVLVKAVLTKKLQGVYSQAWEVPTTFIDKSNWQYIEHDHYTIYKQPFSKLFLWKTNYLPIQSVLFHRRLYEENGGFDTNLDCLEDWDLWIRYTYHSDFEMVEKTTSKYRVPAVHKEAVERLKLIEEAQSTVYKKQDQLGDFTTSAKQLKVMLADYQRAESLISVSRTGLKHQLFKTRIGQRIYRRREVIRRLLRKLGL